MQLESGLRDELAEIARTDFSGVPLAEALRRLIKEHQISKIMARYTVLQADPDEWASYRIEARLTDNAAADGLPEIGDHSRQQHNGNCVDEPIERSEEGDRYQRQTETHDAFDRAG